MARRQLQKRHRKSVKTHSKHLKTAAAALTAAGTIAASTQAYAVPKRFNNPAPGQPGHFDWNGTGSGLGPGLDLRFPSTEQSGSGSPSFLTEYYRTPWFPSGCFQAYITSGFCWADSQRTLLFGGTTTPGETAQLAVPFLTAGAPISAATSWTGLQIGVRALERYTCGYSISDPLNPPPPPGCTVNPPPGAIGYSINYYDPMPNNQNVYLGARFDGGDGIHYGWIGVRRTGFDVRTFAWGYETQPGVPITAGVVPEPGTLALLAFGATAVASRRRKQKA